MKKVVYFNTKEHKQPKPTDVQSITLHTQDLMDDDESLRIQKNRVRFLKNQAKQCPTSRQAYANLPFIEQQIVNDQIDIQNEQQTNYQLRKQVQSLQAENSLLWAELEQYKGYNNKKDQQIQYLSENLDNYKRRNEALLSKLQRMQIYLMDEEKLYNHLDSHQLKEFKQLKDENYKLLQQLKNERSKSLKQQQQLQQQKVRKASNREIKDIQRLIIENQPKDLMQSHKNIIQEILFNGYKESFQGNTNRFVWKNPLLVNPPLLRSEVPGSGIKVLRQLAKHLNKSKQNIEIETVQKSLSTLSDQLRIQMQDDGSRVYLCLGQCCLLAQHLIYDGSSLLELFQTFTEPQLLGDSTNSMFGNSERTMTIQSLSGLMNNFGPNYEDMYNQVDYFKALDYHKLKDFVQLNEQQVQNFSFGAATTLWNYLLSNYNLNNNSYFTVLREYIDRLLTSQKVQKTFPHIYQIIMQKEAFHDIPWHSSFMLVDNIQLIDYTSMFTCYIFTIMLIKYRVQLFEIYEGVKKLLVNRYQSQIREDDLNNISDDKPCTVIFPCITGPNLCFKARVIQK